MNEQRYRAAERRLWESVGVDPTERRIDLARTGSSARVQEVGDGPPVLFVHGGSAAGTCWSTLVADLDGFHRIVLDRPGCGLSAPLPGPVSTRPELEQHADGVLVDVLDALELPTAHVVSTSFGGLLCLRSVAAHPDRFDRVVHHAWPFGAPIEKLPPAMRLASVRPIGRAMAALPPPRWAVTSILKQLGLRDALRDGRVGDEMIDWFRAVFRDTDTMRNELDSLPPLKATDLEAGLFDDDLLAGITTPIRFLWGEDDICGGAGTARAFADRIPAAELELLAGAGHVPWLHDREWAAARTAGFLHG